MLVNIQSTRNKIDLQLAMVWLTPRIPPLNLGCKHDLSSLGAFSEILCPDNLLHPCLRDVIESMWMHVTTVIIWSY